MHDNLCLFPFTRERAVISDYVPKPSRGVARGAMLAASIVAALGLLKVRSKYPLRRILPGLVRKLSTCYEKC